MTTEIANRYGIDRRGFMKAGLAGMVAASSKLDAGTPGDEKKPTVWVIEGEDKARLMREALEIIERNGGFGKQVRKLALKVNAAWARRPEQGANTHPQLVRTFVRRCHALGIKEIVIPENPCNRAEQSFTRSGLREAAEQAGADMIDLKNENQYFTDVRLPEGERLKKARVARQFLEADAVVNMPVAKHHGGATLTMGMKNWMGAVEDRHFWHRNNLHQCIADFSTLMRPTWSIIDATRILPDRGPQGPSPNLRHPNKLIVSRDPIAADAVAALLFFDEPRKVQYLHLAHDMGLGVIDPERITVYNFKLG